LEPGIGGKFIRACELSSVIVPVNKVELLAPWVGLAALAGLAALTVALVRRRRA